MKIHLLSVPDALASLKSGLGGLADSEARRRLAEYGTNEVKAVSREALWLTFTKEFVHFLHSFCGSPPGSPSSPSCVIRDKAWPRSGLPSSGSS